MRETVWKPAAPKLGFADALRALGAIAVVEIHSVAPRVASFDANHSGVWWMANLIDAGCRWVVPVFVMLSGALLLDPSRSETAGAFFRKRFFRAGIPLLFWSAFYLAWRVEVLGYNSPGGLVRALAFGNAYYHLHFLFIIAGLYSITPLLRLFVARASRKELGRVIVVALAAASADSVVRRVAGFEYSAFFKFAPYTGYFLAGWFLREVRVKRKMIAIVAGGLAATAPLIGGATYAIHLGIPRIDPFIVYDYLSLPVIVQSVAIFLLVSSLCPDGGGESASITSRVVRVLATASLGIYLIHPALLDILDKLSNESMAPGIAWTALGRPMVALTGALLITDLLQRLPLMHFALGSARRRLWKRSEP